MHFDSTTGLNDLRKMLEDTHSETGIRPGDMYGLIVEHHVKAGEIEQALGTLEQMRNYTNGKSLTYFLNPETTAVIQRNDKTYFKKCF